MLRTLADSKSESENKSKNKSKNTSKSGGILVALFLLACAPCGWRADAAEIVAQIDGEIITERDVTARSLLFQNNLSRLLPALRIRKEDRKAFALDLLLQQALQRRHLLKELALPVTDAAVKNRLSRLPTIKGGKAERLFWEGLARHELTWEGYVGRVAEFNTPVTSQDSLDERARLRTSAAEPRYRLEEIFLPRLEAGATTRRISEALYRSLKGARSFARVANLLPAPYAHAGFATQTLYRSALPPSVLEALEDGKVDARGIVAPISSPYGEHLYRVTRQGHGKKITRYDFVQTIFLQNGYGAQQAAVFARAEFCDDPQDASLSLQAYDLQVFDDIPQQDLGAETAQLLASVSEGETAGPFPFQQGLIIMITLCDKRREAERGDSFEELTSTLRLKRARTLALRLVENLRTQASIEKRTNDTKSSLLTR